MLSSSGPEVVHVLDRIAEDRIHRERDQFIEDINEENICNLASSYHNNDICTFFKPPARGSYNICYFVRFASHHSGKSNGEEKEDADLWVVRVPLSPCLAFGAHNKLESEIATMRLVSERTTIPVPRVIAYSLASKRGSWGIASFLILEYIEGKRLCEFDLSDLPEDQTQHLYSQLADIYIQLRRLEFSSVGALTCDHDVFEVRKKPLSIDINVQELEGLQPSHIQAEYGGGTGVVTSASDYISMLVHIARNAFRKSRTSVLDEDDGKDALYYLDQFCQYAERGWPKAELDHGPFVLVHGDFNPQNLIVTEKMDILGLIDWEWARIVPLQFFNPPKWLAGLPPSVLALPFVYSKYVIELNKFRSAVQAQELRRYKEERLSKDWAKVDENESILVAAALENWTEIHNLVKRFLDRYLHKDEDEDLEGRIRKFIQDVPAYRDLVAQKACDRIAYEEDIRLLQAKSQKKQLVVAAETNKSGSGANVPKETPVTSSQAHVDLHEDKHEGATGPDTQARSINSHEADAATGLGCSIYTDDKGVAPRGEDTWNIISFITRYLFPQRLAKDMAISSNWGQILRKHAIGNAILLAGISYFICKHIVR